MSEPLPTTQPSEETIAYRPISGWAIAGCAAGGLFAALTVFSTIAAVVQGAPMFFPVWVVGLAVAGIVLSFLGQRQVQNSEGTRAGAKLARVGLWLSLVSGLCYLSYYFVTELAVSNQADDFLMVKSDQDSGFFPRLREGATDPVQLNHAFLLTVPANQRSARPDNEKSMRELFDVPNKDNPGNLSIFKEGNSNGLIGVLPNIFFKQNAKDVKIEAGEVQDWEYKEKSYMVRRRYRIETKEAIFDVTLLVRSTEAETAGQARKWFLVLPQSAELKRELTAFGVGLTWLRLHARRWLEQEVAIFNDGKSGLKFTERDKTDWANVRDSLRDKKDAIYKLFDDDTKKRFENFNVPGQGREVGRWEEVGGKIRIYTAFRFGLPKTPGQPIAYWVDGSAVFEPESDRINPAEVDGNTPAPKWQLIQIVFNNLTPMGKGGGPGG